MNLEIGKTYRIRHTRKGEFSATVLHQEATWVDVLITEGIAKRASGDPDYPGDAITIRKTHFTAESC